MAKAKAKKRADSADVQSPLGDWLTQAAFAATLIVMIARALMSESVRDAFDVAGSSTGGPAGPGPTTTLLLDALACVPALLVLVRRAIDRQYVVRWAWSQALLGLFTLWAAISVAWASDKFVAIIAAANFVAVAALVWSTAQLVRSWMRLRIVAGVCFGLLLAYTAHGLIYRYVDAADNVKFWNENKEQIFRDRGWEPDSAIAKQFEKKFLSGEMIGFHQSPNSFAAVIVMFMVVSAGVAMGRRVSGDAIGWSAIVAVACAAALVVLYYTASRTAGGTLVLSAIALAMLSRLATGEWLAKHSARAYWIGVGVFVLGIAALVGHGVTHGSLPQDSLNFRWRYWAAAARLVERHPVIGVGWANFGPHYLAVRAAAAAEEVSDPHNFIVRAFAELGLIGGLLVTFWLARAAWELTQPVMPPASAKAQMSVAAGFTMISAIAVGGVLLNMLAVIDWSQNSAYLILESFRRLLFLGLLCIGMVVATTRGMQTAEMDDRPGPWVLYAAIIALGAFFVHTLMDFVLAEPGAATAFAVLLGAATGLRTPSAAGAKKRRGVAMIALVIALIAWLGGIGAAIIPIANAEQQARAGDAALRRGEFALAAGLLDSAYRTAKFNADYAYRDAIASIRAGSPPEKVKAALDIASATDPSNVMYYLTRARHELRQGSPDIAAVRADFEKALALDPQNIEARLEYADVLKKFHDPRAAAEQYCRALATNNGYDPKETERLAPEKVKQIEQMIGELAK